MENFEPFVTKPIFYFKFNFKSCSILHEIKKKSININHRYVGKILEVVMKLKSYWTIQQPRRQKRESRNYEAKKLSRTSRPTKKKPASKREKGLKKREEFYALSALSVSFLRHHYMSHTQRTSSLIQESFCGFKYFVCVHPNCINWPSMQFFFIAWCVYVFSFDWLNIITMAIPEFHVLSFFLSLSLTHSSWVFFMSTAQNIFFSIERAKKERGDQKKNCVYIKLKTAEMQLHRVVELFHMHVHG